jgi:hypothetical protein
LRPGFYERELGGRLRTFHLIDEQLTDQETSTTWAPAIGLAVAGPLKGKHLPPLPAFVCYYSACKGFHPTSQSLFGRMIQVGER